MGKCNYGIMIGFRHHALHACNEQNKARTGPIFFSEILCPYPPYFQTSYYSLDTRTPGSVVEYTCNAGYHMVEGMASWSCSDEGFWMGEEPVCEGKCIAL